jgi:hypothetical protein
MTGLSTGPDSAHVYNLAGTQTQPRSQVASQSTPPSQQSLNYRTVPTVLESYYELPLLALNIFLTGRFTLSYGKHLTSLCGYSSPQLACPLPLTARSSPSRLPFQLLEATHLISYERGLLCIPPRRHDEPEPWENHPIMQSLLKRLQSKWRTHRAQATTLSTPPRPQPRQATPAQTQAATTWLFTPQTMHIGTLRVCYRPSPIATYALLSTWQSTLKKLCPDNIGKWIRNWLSHVYPSLHLEVGQTPQAQESQWWWSEWLTHLTHKRIQFNLDECPNPHSPEAVSTFLQRRMEGPIFGTRFFRYSD